MKEVGKFPADFIGKVDFFVNIFLNLWVISSMVGGFLALICWMVTMTKFELSYAYPFISLSFVLVLLMSNIFLNEPLTQYKVIGVILIIAGVVIGSQK
jgi:drug/metabolite transporter (DMT)-like permease